MQNPGTFMGRLLPRLAAGLALLLAVAGLAERWSGPDISFRLHNLRVIARDSATDAQLRPLAAGDRLRSVGGVDLRRDLPSMAALADGARRGPVLVEYERAGQLRAEYLRLHPPSPARRFGLALRTLAAVLVFLTGLWVSRRRRDSLSRLFLILTILTGSIFALIPRVLASPWSGLLESFNDLVVLFLPPVFLHFLIHFPERRPRPWNLRLLIYLPTAVLAVFVLAAISRDLALGSRLLLLQRLASLNAALLLLGCLAILALKALRRKHRRERYRVRRVLFGALLSLLPLAIFQLLHQLLPGRHLQMSVWTPLFLTILPLSFAYGILGPNLTALNRRADILRRFLLVGGGLLLIFLAARLFLHQVWGPSARLAADIISDLLSLSAALLFMPFLLKRTRRTQREREDDPFRDCARWLAPPRFFTEPGELRQSLLPRLGWDSGASWVLWLEKKDEQRWIVLERWRREGGSPQSITLPEIESTFTLPAGLERTLLTGPKLLAVEQWDPYWAESLMGSEALPYCKQRDWALLRALGVDSKHPAVLLFGPSAYEALYHVAVLEGFEELCTTLELHLRNLSLLAQATREEQLRTELDLARNIQHRLLPHRTPRISGVELAGRIVASREVGGDYYDFLSPPDGQLGLALGDATGHGIPAALLISSVALAFHSQAAGGSPPELVLSEMNRALCSLVADHRPSGVFAGFIYAQFDPGTGILGFCNGGMPPPWVLRAGGRWERLRRGGFLLGMSEEGIYQRGMLRLRRGDLLFIRSDGLEDQENSREEEYGEARLLGWLKRSQHLGLEKLSDRLIEEIAGFSGGNREDDISFVFMRMTA